MIESLHYQSATELAASIRRRDLGVVEVVEAFLGRIGEVNPSVNAIVTLRADEARETAKQLDEHCNDRSGKPLYGLPIGIKDLVLTKGVRTTFGSPIYQNFVPDTDELLVERVKQAGAIVIGKTNTPEFGAGSNTFNAVFGETRNPYDLTKTCGGSSGGAAAALACGMLPLADGNDLGGSLRNPAAFCNVVGFRPTPGRVPIWPKQLSSDQLGVAGPMARTIEDLRLLLSVIAGPDPRVPISIPDPGSIFARPLAADFDEIRLAWSPDLGRYEVESEIITLLETQLPIFESLGCKVDRSGPDLADVDEIFQTLRAWMFATKFRDDYRRHPELIKDTVIWNIERGLELTIDDITAAELKRAALIGRISSFFQRYDYLICPTTQVLPFPVEQEWVDTINGKKMHTYLDWMGLCYAITVTGCPAISMPAGFSATGLPVGIQIVGPRWKDFEVLQLAHAFETATGFWQRRPAL